MAQIINNLAKGMIRGANPLKKDSEFYNFALNITKDDNQLDTLTRINEHKLEPYYSLKDVDYLVLNALYLDIDEYVFFITNQTATFSEIIYYNKGDITVKYNNSSLNFNPQYIISSTFRVNYNGDRIVYFVDGFNKDRVINIDKIKLTDNIESLSINPIYTASNYLDYSISDGGNLKAGEISIFISYNDINDKESYFKDYIENIPLGSGTYSTATQYSNTEYANYTENKSAINSNVFGLTEPSYVSKSINIKPVINPNYSTANIYVIYKNNTLTEVYLKENVSLDTVITISDLNDFILLGSDVSSVIVSNIIYNNSEAITQKDNRLILANTKLEGYNFDFQSIANQIKVEPVVNELPFDGSTLERQILNPSTEVGTNTRRSSPVANLIKRESYRFSDSNYLSYTQSVEVPAMSFMRDDVYALGVYFELDNGAVTDVYHIPGRLPNAVRPELYGKVGENMRVYSSGNASTWDTTNVNVNGKSGPAWSIINTGLEGMMGYHRCDIVYPDNYGFPTDGEKNGQGKSYIRHHRIPSDLIYPIVTSEVINTNKIKRVRNLVNLKFSNIIIPSTLQNKVKNIYFCMANRDEFNKKVIDKGLVYSTREVSDYIRNSELLNNPRLKNNLSDKYYEFTSPTIDFKFKNFNIKADTLKLNYVYSGYVDYMIKTLATKEGSSNNDMRNRPYVDYVNLEGVDISNSTPDDMKYNFKQALVLTRVNYNYLNKFDNTLHYNLENNIFLDNNSSSNLGKILNFEGSQNTSVLKINNAFGVTANDLLPGDNYNSLVLSQYKTSAGVSTPGKLFDYFYYQGNTIPNYSNRYRLDNVNQNYFDATNYVTLLSDNNNLFSNLLQLTYTRLIANDEYVCQGDTFIENHHTKKSYSALLESDAEEYKASTPYIKKTDTIQYATNYGLNNLDMLVSETYITYPVETRLNIRMRSHEGDNNHYPYNIMYANYPFNELEKKALTQEVFKLNTEFTDSKGVITFFPNKIKTSDLSVQNKKLENRLIYSELQNTEATKDSFREFKANNYKDIKTTKGPIYKLFIKDNNLYILTRDSIFVINSSNNYLKTVNDTTITVGTGEFFGVEPEELVTLETGFAGTSSKLSFSESKFGYLYVDSIRNKIILFSKSLDDINIRGLEEDLSINLYKHFPQLNTGQDKPLLGYGILTGYDPVKERLLITKLDYNPTTRLLNEFRLGSVQIKNGLFYKGLSPISFNDYLYFENKSFTVSYDGNTNTWISYHDYLPNYYVPNPRELNPKLENINRFGENYADRFILDITFNESPMTVKVFDSLQFDIISEDKNGRNTYKFFDSLVAYNDHQSTGLVELNNTNLTRKETKWMYNYLLDNSKEQSSNKLFTNEWDKIRPNYYIDKVVNESEIDLNKPWNKKHRLRDKFLNLRLMKNNTENNKFYINFAMANVRQSIR